MSPALSREERDAILARHDDRQHFEEGSFLRRMAAERSSDDVPALLDALDAAEDQIEQLQRQRAGALAELERLHRIKEAIFSSNGRILRENDALRTEKIAAKRRLGAAEAEIAALRGRIEGLASRWDTLSGDMLRGALVAAADEIERLRGDATDLERLADTYTTEGTVIVLNKILDLRAECDAARAEVAALRGRIEALHVPDDHGPGRCDKPACVTACRECGDDWPCATIRALDDDSAAHQEPVASSPLLVEWGVVADDFGSTEVFPSLDQAEAHAVYADGTCPIVRIETWPHTPGTAVPDIPAVDDEGGLER